MPSPAWDDLDAFVDADDFAVPAVIVASGVTRRVNVIFDDPYLDAQVGEYDHTTSEPRATAKETDVVGVRRGDTLTINRHLWDILDVPRPDGTGFAVIRLANPVLVA